MGRTRSQEKAREAMTRYRVFAWPVPLFIGIAVAFVAGAIATWFAPAPLPMRLIASACALGGAAALGAVIWRRIAYAETIKGQTDMGVWIIVPAELQTRWQWGRLNGAIENFLDIQREIRRAVAFWLPNYSTRSADIDAKLDGLILRLSPTRMPTVKDGQPYMAKGLSWTGESRVWWPPDDQGGTALMLALVRHEISHQILDACGIPQDNQHAVMGTAGLGA